MEAKSNPKIRGYTSKQKGRLGHLFTLFSCEVHS